MRFLHFIFKQIFLNKRMLKVMKYEYFQIDLSESEKPNKILFLKIRKIDNHNKCKNYVIVTRVKLSVELDVLVIRERSIFIQFYVSNIIGVLIL